MSTEAHKGSVDLDNANLGTPEQRKAFFDAIESDPTTRIAELCVANLNNVNSLVQVHKQLKRIESIFSGIVSVFAAKKLLTEEECNAIFEAVVSSEMMEAAKDGAEEEAEAARPGSPIVGPDSTG